MGIEDDQHDELWNNSERRLNLLCRFQYRTNETRTNPVPNLHKATWCLEAFCAVFLFCHFAVHDWPVPYAIANLRGRREMAHN
jgi:hypothetical protein